MSSRFAIFAQATHQVLSAIEQAGSTGQRQRLG